MTHSTKPMITTGLAHAAVRHHSHPDGRLLLGTVDGMSVSVGTPSGTELAQWLLGEREGQATLTWSGPSDARPGDDALLATLDTVFTAQPDRRMLRIDAPRADTAALVATGALLPQSDGSLVADRELLWQQARLWLGPRPQQQAYAQQLLITEGRRHPRRAPKARGRVYERYIPWLQATLSLRSLDIEQDLERFNRWMNDPAVAHFWQEEGDLAKHRAYLQAVERDPHMSSLIACLDGQPFGYFEVYWAKENRLAPFYDADDFDRGWHVLIGEPAYRGKPYATAWLPSISHYLFLSDSRTQRVMGEPRSDHHRQIRNLQKCGYAHVKDFDFPHKRATLVMLLRERFFGDAFWLPRADPSDATS